MTEEGVKEFYNKNMKGLKKMRAICIEDQIAEKLKDVCNYKAVYVVRFNYGSIEVEEVHDDRPKTDNKHPSLFDGE